MKATRHILGAVTGLALVLAATAVRAERLNLSFLPPDLPPSDICNKAPERFGDDETQVTDGETDQETLDDTGRLEFLTRDIRNLRRKDAEGSFDYIMALITRRAELDPAFAGTPETFERIDTYLAAGRIDGLRESGLIQALADRLPDLGWTETVRLSRFYMNGLGVAKDRDFAVGLIVDQAYLGSANALLEVLRMQLRGEEVDGWSVPTDETARLAFGGLIGRLNGGMCARAERMAREYIDGDLLAPNPTLAFAWRKFAADMGGGDTAWRVVEHYLSADGTGMDEVALRHYLQQAVRNGAVILPETVDEVVASSAKTEAEVRRVLGRNHVRTMSSERRSPAGYFDLDVRITPPTISEDGEYFQYLTEVSAYPEAPGHVLTSLAKEIFLRKGRWAGEEDALPLLEEAISRGDPEAMDLMAGLLLRRPEDPVNLERAEALLSEIVGRFGQADGMKSLDRLYRCQLPGAPYLPEADHWAGSYRAANVEPLSISAPDLAALDGRQDPDAVARIQSLALRGHSGSAADWLSYLQSDRFAPDAALRHWARRVAGSDVALEDWMVDEFELALSAEARDGAVELFRRVYLDIGSSVALELAVALVDHSGHDPGVAAEIGEILTASARRGEGAAIRLLQRLTGEDGSAVYRRFAKEIEARGDFLAHMFAAPFVPDETFERYMQRAVSLMNCSTKDVMELADAHVARGLDDAAAHWLRVGLALDGGNSLSKLGLSDRQVARFDRGQSIAADMLDRPVVAESGLADLQMTFLETADRRSDRYDPETAGEALAGIFGLPERDAYLWALGEYRRTSGTVRKAVDRRIDVVTGLTRAAEAGDRAAQYELGMLRRVTAKTPQELETSMDWMAEAADAGHRDAMIEYAYGIGFGIGRRADPKLAMIWLDRAERLHPGSAEGLRALFGAMAER